MGDEQAAVVRRISVPSSIDMVNVLGPRDEFLRVLERELEADVHVRGNEVTLTGTHIAVSLAADVVNEMVTVLRTGQGLTPDAVERICSMMTAAEEARPADVLTHNILSSRGKTIRPKTLNQKRYVDAIDKHTVVFGIGPAGTGKTYLAVAKAVQALQNKEVNRIILTRPAVEAGERLGFLPGTLNEKIDPYLRPLYDALHDMLDPDSVPRLLTAGTIEVAPLAYMRGRAQPVDTPVLTPDGFRPIGELHVGDLVVGSDGRPTPVLGVHPQGAKDVYRVSSQDGASTLACGEHLWSVATRSDRRRGKGHRVLQTKDMVGNLRAAHAHRYELPVVGAVQMPVREVPIDPYALGLLLGEGCLTTTMPRTEAGRGGLLIAGPTEVPHELGLDGTRPDTTFIPEQYLTNSEAIRLAVLQGLLDAGGEPIGQVGRPCRVEYATHSDRLRDDVIMVVRSLGGIAYLQQRHDAHVIDIRLPAGVAPFRLTRKAAIYDDRVGGRPMRFIHAIEPAGTADCVCISVGAADSLYVTEDFLVTHNTLNDAFIILDEAQNTSMEQMKMFLTRLGFGAKIVVTGDITQVDLPGGTRSGLRVVQGILDHVDDISFCYLTNHDVVRHKLVGRIVAAYDRFEATDTPVPLRTR